jgi:anti-sigma regulatory factor (Ser/Thr protein kinase)
VLAPELTPADVIAALRHEVFSCFTMPAPAAEVRDAVAQALDAERWKNGIEVISAVPHWISLRVACRRTTADRLTRFIAELAGDLANAPRFELATAFREVLLNAMEHGAGFDANKVIEVAAIRTERAIVYYFKDPGPGFDPTNPGLVATDTDPLSHLAARDEQGQRAGGFGMLLTSRLVDEVHYSEQGNEVFLVKHLDKLENGGTARPAATTSSV